MYKANQPYMPYIIDRIKEEREKERTSIPLRIEVPRDSPFRDPPQPYDINPNDGKRGVAIINYSVRSQTRQPLLELRV